MMVKDIFLTSLEGESFKRIQGSDVPTVFRDDMTFSGDEIHLEYASRGEAGGSLVIKTDLLLHQNHLFGTHGCSGH
jgi:hypothetical protein